jgi:hypothetical protein
VSVIPKAGVGNNMPLIIGQLDTKHYLLLISNLSSFVFDYIARQKIGGVHVNLFLIKQLPVLPPSVYEGFTSWDGTVKLLDWIFPRVLELTYTAWDLEPFARDCGYEGAPFKWDEERRYLLRCELDAAYFHLYGIPAEDVAYIMDTFPIVRRKDEGQYGTYRTKETILAIYEKMAAAAGSPYRTL